MKEEILRSFAELVVKKGVNVQKGQPVTINTALENQEFVRLLALEAYKAGASYVNVEWMDSEVQRYGFLYRSEEELKEIPDWVFDKMIYFQNRKGVKISIASFKPDAMEGVSPAKMAILQRAASAHPKFAEVMTYTMANKGQWCVCSYPNKEWARKMFPDLNEEDAYEALWEAIMKTSRVIGESNPIDNWTKHNAMLDARCRKMNAYNFKSLHYKNKLGTDFEIELIPHHLWRGGNESTVDGVPFNPNIPSEEIFTAPNKFGVNGHVVATKPLYYNGKLIEGMEFDFKDGKVVNFKAEKEEETLKTIVENDPGSCYLGEVALVPFDSPISKSGLLFYNTLFDENAACHLALGMAYPTCLENGVKMSVADQEKAGLNHALTHVDFMIGSADLEIIGTTFDNRKIPVFKNGNFAF